MSQMTTDRFHLVSIMHIFLILQLLTVVLNYTTPCIWFMPKKANIFIWQIGLTIWHIYTYAFHFSVLRILTFLCLFYEFCSCFVMHYNHLILFIKSNMTGVTSETGIAYPHPSSSRFLVAFGICICMLDEYIDLRACNFISHWRYAHLWVVFCGPFWLFLVFINYTKILDNK
jgi:hypothetical protein